MTRLILLWMLAGTTGILFTNCEKEAFNPFLEKEKEAESIDSTSVKLDPTSIAGLHADIFSKTCANAGCHDGNFEPDFRTIESTYNTLVYHPIIKNDPSRSFKYRVVPGEVEKSLLIARLTRDIDGQSGIMPLALEPDSDWPENREKHIENIKTWIENGALDIFGNPPSLGNGLPNVLGVIARADSWVGRGGKRQAPLRVSTNTTSLELFFALEDDETDVKALRENKIRFAKSSSEFATADPISLEIMNTPVVEKGLNVSSAEYYHRVTINPQDYGEVGETIFFRIYVQDDSNPVTEIPTTESLVATRQYFSFELVE